MTKTKTLDKETRVQGGNPELAEAEENRVATDSTSTDTDYSDIARVYVMSSARHGRGVLPKPELGKTERRVINCAARLANVMDKSGTPLPLQATITPDEKMLYYGAQFALEKNITGMPFADDLEAIVDGDVIRYIAVMLDSFFPFAYVLYGRNDRPEYFATIPMRGEKDGEQ